MNYPLSRIPFAAALFFAVTAVITVISGCGKQSVSRTSDPQLKPIQNMLDEALPAGSPDSKVLAFLDARGYRIEPATKQDTIVAIIRHIDTSTVTPVTARVTFYFDSTHHLTNFELQRTLNEPIPQ